MSYTEAFAARKDEAVQQWTDAIFSMYPFETSGFLRTQSDRFANPVGHATRQAALVLYDAVAGQDMDMNAVAGALQSLMRIRAVQDLRPDQALGALFLLKPVLRKLFLTDVLVAGELNAFLDMESRVDSLALLAFNQYCTDREAVFEQRVNDSRRERAQLVRLASKHDTEQEKDGGGAAPTLLQGA